MIYKATLHNPAFGSHALAISSTTETGAKREASTARDKAGKDWTAILYRITAGGTGERIYVATHDGRRWTHR